MDPLRGIDAVVPVGWRGIGRVAEQPGRAVRYEERAVCCGRARWGDPVPAALAHEALCRRAGDEERFVMRMGRWIVASSRTHTLPVMGVTFPDVTSEVLRGW